MTMKKRWAFAVIGFDHMHAGDFIRTILSSDRAELAGVWDGEPERLTAVADDLGLPARLRFPDVDDLIGEAIDVAVVCSTTRDHPHWVGRLAAAGINVIVEKPFATELGDADEMIAAAERSGVLLAVNWPLAWYPPHRTTERLIREGTIGEVREIHYYDGNRGPLRHLHDKREVDPAANAASKRATWWYQEAAGGGSLLDYLGYGATLSTWFRANELPTSITARTHVLPGDEVDEQSVVIASFAGGLSTFHTRWGTFTDPWTHQPQPLCGFVVAGSRGTISSYDYRDHITLQTEEHPEGVRLPVDELAPENRNGVEHVIAALEGGGGLTGPLSPVVSRIGQRIVDSARESARLGRTVELLDARTEGEEAPV
ncbi:MAG TPA: Gfo/Idh/MocA family oxidoreductase [Candidatus Dormibacteraeota bacterium]|jgi:glucose-fructose oxidoreductase|nr:Gfo/Idh/MocA family oxidoreductase [Candidatus Dormibacteraeota bacterium]